MEILDVAYKWESQFETQLTLRESIFFILGSLRIPFTLEEFHESFNVFSAIQPQYLRYSKLQKNQLWKYLIKLSNKGYVNIQSERGSEITVSLTKSGIEEAESLIRNNSSRLVDERMSSLKEYFGIS